MTVALQREMAGYQHHIVRRLTPDAVKDGGAG
jgi:hypothetical protein